MNLQEINFEQAKLLKQAGFVEHTTKFYDKNGVLTGSLPVNHNLHKDRFSAVSVAAAIEWIRREKGIYCWVSYHSTAPMMYLANMHWIGKGLAQAFSFKTDYHESLKQALDKGLYLATNPEKKFAPHDY